MKKSVISVLKSILDIYSPLVLTIIPWARVGYEMVNITNLISNKREWNYCFIKFGMVVYLVIIAKFKWFVILQNDQKFKWQKQQQVWSHMACAPYVNLVCWTNVYQRRIFNLGQKVWKAFKFESSRIRRVLVGTLAHNSCKSTAENFDRHVTDVVSKLFSNSLTIHKVNYKSLYVCHITCMCLDTQWKTGWKSLKIWISYPNL